MAGASDSGDARRLVGFAYEQAILLFSSGCVAAEGCAGSLHLTAARAVLAFEWDESIALGEWMQRVRADRD